MKAARLNFLFVMPKLVQSIGDGYVFPLGIAYVSASMKKAGFQLFTLNLNHHNGEIGDIPSKCIMENHPGVKKIFDLCRLACERTGN